MRKRAGFARALVLEPEIVMFDEPDSGLDPVRTALLCELIQEIHAEQGGAYVVITHNIAAARAIGEYIAVLWKGRIVQAGEASDMFASEDPFVRQFLNRDVRGPAGDGVSASRSTEELVAPGRHRREQFGADLAHAVSELRGVGGLAQSPFGQVGHGRLACLERVSSSLTDFGGRSFVTSAQKSSKPARS